MASAFSGSADFSGMNGERDLFLSNVVHKAVVDVNDIGSAVLGHSRGVDAETVRQALKDNPLGQGAEQTPVGILRRS